MNKPRRPKTRDFRLPYPAKKTGVVAQVGTQHLIIARAL
jgi:hypothetical protein